MNNTTTTENSLQANSQCFILPYGAVGFGLDLAALHGLSFLLDHQSPWSGKGLEHQPTNMYFSTIGLLGSIGVAIYNTVRFRASLPWIFASVWKGSHASMFNAMSLSCNNNSRKNKSNTTCLVWIELLYAAISIAGMAEVSRIARAAWGDSTMKIVCGISIVALILGTMCVWRFVVRSVRMEPDGDLVIEWIVAAIFCVCIIGDMVLNWILAAATQNFGGVPIKDEMVLIATYVVYIITTLLPLTSA